MNGVSDLQRKKLRDTPPRLLWIVGTSATIEVHQFFSQVFLNLGAQDLPKTDFEKEKKRNCYVPDENSMTEIHGDENRAKTNDLFRTILG